MHMCMEAWTSDFVCLATIGMVRQPFCGLRPPKQKKTSPTIQSLSTRGLAKSPTSLHLHLLAAKESKAGGKMHDRCVPQHATLTKQR